MEKKDWKERFIEKFIELDERKQEWDLKPILSYQTMLDFISEELDKAREEVLQEVLGIDKEDLYEHFKCSPDWAMRVVDNIVSKLKE